MSNLAIRWILDNYKTTGEAVDFLEKMPKVWGETYIIIDKDNTIAKVEAHNEQTRVTFPETGFEWNSLLYDSPDMQRNMDQERIDNCIDFTSTRRAFLTEWFPDNKGAITSELLSGVLKSHEHKMCYHELEGLEICWSYILEIGAEHALVCAGRPCENQYQEVKGP